MTVTTILTIHPLRVLFVAMVLTRLVRMALSASVDPGHILHGRLLITSNHRFVALIIPLAFAISTIGLNTGRRLDQRRGEDVRTTVGTLRFRRPFPEKDAPNFEQACRRRFSQPFPPSAWIFSRAFPP
jgi:hypothetical protein